LRKLEPFKICSLKTPMESKNGNVEKQAMGGSNNNVKRFKGL
jgi:hypothetical protein